MKRRRQRPQPTSHRQAVGLAPALSAPPPRLGPERPNAPRHQRQRQRSHQYKPNPQLHHQLQIIVVGHVNQIVSQLRRVKRGKHPAVTAQTRAPRPVSHGALPSGFAHQPAPRVVGQDDSAVKPVNPIEPTGQGHRSNQRRSPQPQPAPTRATALFRPGCLARRRQQSHRKHNRQQAGSNARSRGAHGNRGEQYKQGRAPQPRPVALPLTRLRSQKAKNRERNRHHHEIAVGVFARKRTDQLFARGHVKAQTVEPAQLQKTQQRLHQRHAQPSEPQRTGLRRAGAYTNRKHRHHRQGAQTPSPIGQRHRVGRAQAAQSRKAQWEQRQQNQPPAPGAARLAPAAGPAAGQQTSRAHQRQYPQGQPFQPHQRHRAVAAPNHTRANRQSQSQPHGHTHGPARPAERSVRAHHRHFNGPFNCVSRAKATHSR